LKNNSFSDLENSSFLEETCGIHCRSPFPDTSGGRRPLVNIYPCFCISNFYITVLIEFLDITRIFAHVSKVAPECNSAQIERSFSNNPTNLLHKFVSKFLTRSRWGIESDDISLTSGVWPLLWTWNFEDRPDRSFDHVKPVRGGRRGRSVNLDVLIGNQLKCFVVILKSYYL